ncbi:FMN-dependent oxidoreductase (nitrilotriacetate monooxygenase family) [Pseudochelatococcus lubricantis]|uniref:FMN-dependent oxidoreductase (Nitrilotriacetate monooxygenase family) n=1 Tax=Pseudochelatococcus lubricantis TaxID=1538102 RepID=A0ABX0V7D7_9HYPH|nr:NtaA/DmoA family FMN-dependent monooxygenase [Pseudochelatococcus lubricantis]NIJ59695.1 FMN-dependent oxidoreductase (nitrilotriacetate monooxygenase family) [Pseudochelatococcus lubricantis]
MTTPQRQLNLNIGINTTGYGGRAWKVRSGSAADITDPAYYLRLAQLAHRGRFDALFLSDHPALMRDSGQRPLHTLDPLILLTFLAGQVPDIGLVATISTTYNSPYNLARRAQSIDVLTGGRLVVNLVSSFNPAVAANFGNEPLPPREVRYARAIEFVDVAKQLWSSWDPAESGEVPPDHFWDASAAHEIAHEGRFFSVRGPLNVPWGPQGHPVLAQAGASDRGIDFAALHGEIIYANVLSRPAGRAFGERLRNRARALGRDPAGIRIVPGVVPVVAESREAALRKHEILSGTGSEDGLLRRFAIESGLDLATFDPDAPLDPARFVPDQNRQWAVGMALGLSELLTHETLTPRQAVRRSEGHHRLVLGTPEDVADQLIDLWQDGTVDGYTVQPLVAPDDISLFVDKVIPVLQDRGVFRREYAGDTVRERYGLPFPARSPARVAQPHEKAS